MNESPITVSNKYAYFADIFSLKLTIKLSKYIVINNYAIELIDNEQPLYSSIYCLGLMELKILKAYIKNNLANNFIRPSKSLAGTFIFFDQKPDGNLRLYIDYQGFNNLTIKNKYPLLLIEKLLA